MAAPVRKIIVSPKRLGDAMDQDSGAILFRRRVYVAEFAAAATTGNLDLTGFPGGMLIEGAFVFRITPFTGGGAGSATISVGSTGDAVKYVAATTVFTGSGTSIVGLTQVPGTFINSTTPTAAGTVRIALVADVNTNLLTFGKADVYLRLRSASVRTS